MPLLPPGNYEVSMELAGFATAQRPALLTVGASVTLNQTLQLTGVAETITVSAASPLVETSTSIRTSTVGSEAIDNLPINGRRFQDFVTLTPTVQIDTSRGQLSFAGQRGINSNVNIDGADYNQPFFGGLRGGERSNNAFTVPQGAVQEFQVIAAGYSAEFGRSTAGLVNVVTKSGANQVDGSAFYVKPPPRAGRQERLRPDSGADAAAVRGGDRRPDPARPAVLLRRLRAADLPQRARRRLQPDGYSARSPKTPRPTTTTAAWKRTSRPPTTPPRCWARSTTSGRRAAASACATATAPTRR